MRELSQLPSCSFSQCRDDLKTGDIVLFSGRSVSARIVQLVTGSPWSHVGIVVRSDEVPHRLLLWESTRLSKVNDIRRGCPADGVQLVCLAERLSSYNGVVAFRRLADTPSRAHLSKLSEWIGQWHGKPYRNYVAQFLRGLWVRGGLAFGRGGFCSELVAEVYRRWHILPSQRPAHHYIPRHFCDRNGLPSLQQRLSPICRIAN